MKLASFFALFASFLISALAVASPLDNCVAQSSCIKKISTCAISSAGYASYSFISRVNYICEEQAGTSWKRYTLTINQDPETYNSGFHDNDAEAMSECKKDRAVAVQVPGMCD